MFEIYLLEGENWLSEVPGLQKHQSAMRYSFILIHFVVQEVEKNAPLIDCGFHMKRAMGQNKLLKRGDFKVSYKFIFSSVTQL